MAEGKLFLVMPHNMLHYLAEGTCDNKAKMLTIIPSYYGINGHVQKWIEGFLINCTQLVLVDGQSSLSSPVISGVPQGTVFDPLLFLVCINDLPERVTSTARLFADDCLLYRIVSSAEDAAKLQQYLTNLQKWEDDWLMSFNPDICKVLRLTNKRKTYPATYSIHGQ